MVSIMSKEKKDFKKFLPLIVVCVVAVGAGLGLGWFLKKSGNGIGSAGVANVTAEIPTDASQIKNGDVFGSNNADDFKDSVQGYLTSGSDLDEGSHMLLRTGGASQTVYLFSSVTDLNQFNGMEVKLWGETQKGEKAGWLMDVGRLEVINTQGEKPLE